jgi:hypothetical protein
MLDEKMKQLDKNLDTETQYSFQENIYNQAG